MPQSASGNRRMWGLLSVCALLLGISLWLTQQLLTERSGDERLFAPLPCDPELLHQGCGALKGEQQIRFFIDSAPVGSHTPLAFRVELQGFEAQRVELELQGRDMYMGELRLSLERGSDGQYRAQGQLPVCTTGAMIWRARVWVIQPSGRSGSWFDFTAH